MRNNLLTSVWTGPPIMIGGRELVMTPIRYEQFSAWKNPLLYKPDPNDPSDAANKISEIIAIGEILTLCHASSDEARKLRGMTENERAEAVAQFMWDHEDETDDAIKQMADRIKSMEAAGVEIDDMGKPKDAGEAQPRVG